jgi:signal transduction histidine kinase
VFYKDSRLFEELKKVFDDLEQSFISEVVTNAASVPVIYTDQDLNVVDYGNLEKHVVEDERKLNQLIEQMRSQNEPIEIHLQDNQTNYIYYKDSDLLMQLKYYPFVQFAVIGLFAFIAYFLFSYSRREEQNRVWVGMAKETAHQLGTPLSSLLAWVEILKEQPVDPSLVNELSKDLVRLETITERFSKIGAQPQLNPILVSEALNTALSYIQSRSSAKIVFDVAIQNKQLKAMVNQPLFDWVVENLSKNAIDAMNGNGTLSFDVKEENEWVIFDVTDTGKGIAQKNKNAVFEPGFTTKQRGWGLGLSLVKRIVENYHKGKIFVKNSQLGKGTTFRLMLLKA